jgi:hypothetical protein
MIFLRKEIAVIVKPVSKVKTTASRLQFNLRHVRGSRRAFGFLHFFSLDSFGGVSLMPSTHGVHATD